MSESAIAQPKDSATIMLLRDKTVAPGIEVFMLRRHARADFGGAFVFPGGLAAVADFASELEPYCCGLTDTDASTQLGVESGGLALWVAAIRECFEESGYLLARDFNGDYCQPSAPAAAERFSDYRLALSDGALTMVDVCEAEQLSLLCGAIEYVSFWTTPEIAKRRYATRFFVAAVPEGQTGVADGRETVTSRWVDPSDAISAERIAEMNLHPPTIAQLQWLSQFESVAATMDVAAAMDKSTIKEILPRVLDDGRRVVIDTSDGEASAFPMPRGERP
ncbi:MAG: hypothetical protein AAAFM81_03210 [Pseudomonadota bacterium]